MGFLDTAGLTYFWNKVKTTIGLKMDKSVYDPTGKAQDMFAYADKLKTFDVVIRTQAEFDVLIASPDWLGAVSVCFVGDGGALKFTSANAAGIKIPATVKQIQGMNSATIAVTTDQNALWYETLPTNTDYWIRDTKAECIGIGYGFSSCTNLINCESAGNGGSGHGSSFENCTRLVNCKGVGSGARGTGFVNCTDLINCTGNGSGSNGRGIAFQNCTRLTGCMGTGSGAGTGGNGYAFDSCTQVSNCTGTGIGTEGYGFRRCDYVDNCKEGPTPSTTAPYMECTFVGATLEDVPKTAVDVGALPLTGGTMMGSLDMGEYALKNVDSIQFWEGSQLGTDRDGLHVIGPDGEDTYIFGLTSPTQSDMAANKGYVDEKVAAAPENPTSLTPKIGLGYGVCNTAAAATLKEVPVTNFNLVEGARVAVYFQYDVPVSSVLRVNSTMACAIWYCMKPITAGIIRAKDMVEFVFGQNRWYAVSIDRMASQNVFTDKTVAVSSWIADTTYSAQGYGFRAAVACQDVTASYRTDVVFSCADAVGGNYAPVAESYDGGVYIYCKTKPTATVTIPSIVCVKGV